MKEVTGVALGAARLARGDTSLQIAERLGKSAGAVTKAEQGKGSNALSERLLDATDQDSSATPSGFLGGAGRCGG